jgi:hypothetical protein
MYFVLEHSILDLCKTVRGARGITDPVTNGKDKGMTAAQKFLTKAGVAFPFEGPDQGLRWRDLHPFHSSHLCRSYATKSHRRIGQGGDLVK